jgi:nucleotide-binding universal stress UspA family protein
MELGTPQSAIVSAIVLNALIISLLVPLALRGVRYRPLGPRLCCGATCSSPASGARSRARRTPEPAPPSTARILFPSVGAELSERALQAALRLARAERATVVPVFVVSIPLPLALDAPFGRTCVAAFSVFEAIEQRAARAGVPVDSRIARWRNVRHALRAALADVPAQRIVAAAANGKHDGFSVDDIAWLLRNAPHEVVVLRPDPEPLAAAAV